MKRSLYQSDRKEMLKMKIYFILTAVISAFLLLFPLACVGVSQSQRQSTADTAESAQEETEAETEPLAQTVSVLRTSSGKINTLDMKDYIIGVVAAEMPAEYEEDALKAQAVAAYTYTKWLMENADNPQGEADISDDAQSHQGYLDEKQLKEKWGNQFESRYEKIAQCVGEVYGEYLTYEGRAVLSCFHALSPGRTADAKAVWGSDIPYLKSVSAPGDLLSPDIDSEHTLSVEEFQKLCASLDGAKLDENEEKWLGKAEKEDNGFIKTIVIGEKRFSANEIRNAFSLESPYFTLSYSGESFVFKVKGRGHGLGMSQYSADYMARQGSDYKEILLHFYSGVKIEKTA